MFLLSLFEKTWTKFWFYFLVKDTGLITEYLPNLSYFITDFYEKLYDDSLAALTNPSQTSIASTLLSTPPSLLSTTTTPPGPVSSAQLANKTSPPIVLKISTRKLEIIASLKSQIAENELCSTLLIYLINVCFEVNDWVNLKVLLPSIKYPANNANLIEKWFLYQFFNNLSEKSVIEQFKHDWFVTLIFDDFLLMVLKLKDEQSQSGLASNLDLSTNSSITSSSLCEQMYRIIEKLYPAYLSMTNFNRLIEATKPKKFVSFFC